VRIGAHEAMANAAERMIEALGCTGLLGFDFMVDGANAPVLIECNPRPIQTCHLGYRIGVDLVAALAVLLRGGRMPDVPMEAKATLDVLLFPHAYDPLSHRAGVVADVPMTDAGLMRYATRLKLAPCSDGVCGEKVLQAA
jgi:predicted ATP-grasp superfamily ATP-dependent carboligase